MVRRWCADVPLAHVGLAVGLTFMLAACSQPCTVFRLEQQTDTLFSLQLWRGDSLLDTWPIPHPVLSLSQGDITGDGVPEAALCVVKRTRHFEQVARRPWLFKIIDGQYIRPLWLGSQLSHPMHSIEIHDGCVWAVEYDDDSTWLVARYSQRGFGLHHEEYISRHITHEQAHNLAARPADGSLRHQTAK